MTTFAGLKLEANIRKYLNIETITLIDFYKYSNIELNFFTVEFDTMNTINFNHHNNPNIKLLDALYSSCTFPYLFKPSKLENKIYLDGGINVHYPSKYCLEKHKNEEIFCAKAHKELKRENHPNY